MKRFLTLLLALSSLSPLAAQSLKVEHSQSARQALEQIGEIKQPQTAMGYRIGIFFDNSQDARQKANDAKALFTANFPEEPVYMVYESPYYKVSASNCLTEEEAIMLFERVRKIFPNAYVMREKMNISDLIIDQAAHESVVDSLLLKD